MKYTSKHMGKYTSTEANLCQYSIF